jgi:threonine aldolase
MSRFVDLRSDTVTQPTPGMREAMAAAVVGDDGYGEDPTIAALEARYAALVGKEAAIFVPSGVMANQIAVRVLTQPGDVIIAGKSQHVVSYEYGASARNSGVQFALVDDSTGELNLDDVREYLAAEDDHQPHIGLLSIENTHMPSGGTPWSLDALRTLKSVAGERPIHLDGARLFNAVVAAKVSAVEICASATTVMSCLSKGLCAPVGSLLAGPAALMERGRIERKRLGGTMRQAGFLAAAGLLALDNIDRLAEDHARAAMLAQAFAAAFPESGYDPATCQTNIVAFTHPQARQIVHELAERGVAGGTVAPRRARFVVHAGISDDDVAYAVDVLKDFHPRG